MASRSRTPSTPADETTAPSLDAVSSQLDAILFELQSLNRRIDRLTDAVMGRPPGSGEDGAEYPAGRDRDPGDAVPPGVAVQTPAPLTPDDKAVLRELQELPKRRSRSKSKPD